MDNSPRVDLPLISKNSSLQDVKNGWQTASLLFLDQKIVKLKSHFSVDVMSNPLYPSESVKSLGVWFDSEFSFTKHFQSVCRSCFVQLKKFRRVRQYLTTDASILVVNALVSSRLDYYNYLFRSLSRFNLCKLHCVINTCRLARIVTHVLKNKLYWLPIEQCTIFKNATLV